jgi:hypothetical protein
MPSTFTIFQTEINLRKIKRNKTIILTAVYTSAKPGLLELEANTVRQKRGLKKILGIKGK